MAIEDILRGNLELPRDALACLIEPWEWSGRGPPPLRADAPASAAVRGKLPYHPSYPPEWARKEQRRAAFSAMEWGVAALLVLAASAAAFMLASGDLTL